MLLTIDAVLVSEFDRVHHVVEGLVDLQVAVSHKSLAPELIGAGAQNVRGVHLICQRGDNLTLLVNHDITKRDLVSDSMSGP